MLKDIPLFLKEMLIEQYGEKYTEKILDGYSKKRPVTLRVNTLKTNSENVKRNLIDNKIQFKEVAWNENALVLENTDEYEVKKLKMYENGEIYLQSLSAMIPAIILGPKENENILDMAAAPGGKTTQMSAISENKALITACEKNKIRAERLKYNIEKQGVSRVNVLVEDARNLDDYFSFDKILLDSPCSGSGTISIYDEKLDSIFTEELVDRSVKTQHNLLKKALKILKLNGEMIYSTCSILYKENEKELLNLINEKVIEIIPIDKNQFKGIPLLPVSIEGTICVCPNDLYEGFFIADVRKRTNRKRIKKQ